MSLLIKALKKAERDNRAALEGADQIHEMPATEPSSEPAVATSIAELDGALKATVDSKDVAGIDIGQKARAPLSLAEDRPEYLDNRPLIETPRHVPDSASQAVQEPLPEPEPTEPIGMAPAIGIDGSANRMAVSPLVAPAPSTDQREHMPDSSQPAKARPMQIAAVHKTSKPMLIGTLLLAFAAIGTWIALEQFNASTTTSFEPVSNEQLASLERRPDLAMTKMVDSSAGLPSSTADADSHDKPAIPIGGDATSGKGSIANPAHLPNRQTPSDSNELIDRVPTPDQTSSQRATSNAGKPENNTVKRRKTATPSSKRTRATESSTAGNPVAARPSLPPVRFIRAKTTRDEKVALLNEAYRQLRRGNPTDAKTGYDRALQLDRNLTDAWIGLATIAAHTGDVSLAEQHYRQALRIDPNDTVAKAGLATLVANADPVSQESRLRSILAEQEPDAALQFALGNTLASQNRWAEAQQAYFEASAAEPTQPDYAFNLAVSLEQMRQPKAAIEHYRRALQASESAPSGFDPAQARARINAILSNGRKPGIRE